MGWRKRKLSTKIFWVTNMLLIVHSKEKEQVNNSCKVPGIWKKEKNRQIILIQCPTFILKQILVIPDLFLFWRSMWAQLYSSLGDHPVRLECWWCWDILAWVTSWAGVRPCHQCHQCCCWLTGNILWAHPITRYTTNYKAEKQIHLTYWTKMDLTNDIE